MYVPLDAATAARAAIAWDFLADPVYQLPLQICLSLTKNAQAVMAPEFKMP